MKHKYDSSIDHEKLVALHPQYGKFLKSTASLKNCPNGWNHIVITAIKDKSNSKQEYYLNGSYLGICNNICQSSITCFGNGISLDGNFLSPFGTFAEIYVYANYMCPENVSHHYEMWKNRACY